MADCRIVTTGAPVANSLIRTNVVRGVVDMGQPMPTAFAQGVDCLVETMVVTVLCLRDG